MISPELQRRIDAIHGCQGYWVLIVDGEPQTDCGHQWHQGFEEHLNKCVENHWRDISLGFVPTWISFSDYATTGLVGLANFRVFTDTDTIEDPNDAIHQVGYGWNGAGVCVDVRYISNEMIETIQALESYPLIAEDEHAQVQSEVIETDWVDASISDRVTMLQDNGLCIFAARDDDAPWRESLSRLYESILSSADAYPAAYA